VLIRDSVGRGRRAGQTAYSAGSPAQNGLFAAQSAMCQLVQVVNINIAYISLRLTLSWLQQPEVSRDSRDFARRALKHSGRAFKGSAHWPDLLARIIVLICSAIRDSMAVIRHMSASLASSIVVVIAMSGAHSLNTTRPRHTHCTSISRLRGVTTPFISSKVVACSF
jgi:hypothetical protein